MSLTLANMRAEVKSRLNGPGYRYLSDTRVDRFINQARSELDRMYCWHYREKSATGIAPVTISDLGQIEAVNNTTLSYALYSMDYKSLIDLYGDLTTVGQPTYYYTATPSGTLQVATYPTSASNVIGIQYWKITTDLTLDADTPLAPADFHYLIVDMATRLALRANREWVQAQALDAPIAAEIQRMVESVQHGIPDGPLAYTGVTGASEDW